MENFANYILEEQDLVGKIEIMYFLSKKVGVYFDKSVIFKTELARMFIKYAKLKVDENELLTACLLCNCKKSPEAQKIGKIKTYAMEGASYLRELGFSERFCEICEGVNRYSGVKRAEESDILELVDQFGGMLLDRPERVGFAPDEALVLLEHRNLKNSYNRHLMTFEKFVEDMEKVEVVDMVSMKAIDRLKKIYKESKDVNEFVRRVAVEFTPKVDIELDKLIAKKEEEENEDRNRAMFSREVANKIMQKESIINE